jgi:hypothetical protein
MIDFCRSDRSCLVDEPVELERKEQGTVQGPRSKHPWPLAAPPNFSDFGSSEVEYGLQISDSIPPDSLILWLLASLLSLLSPFYDL